MPFIHVKSLPFDKPLDISSVVEGLTMDFAGDTGIGRENITASWEFFLPGHYAVAGKAPRYQPRDSHPVIVDLLVPDFNSADVVRTMLRSVVSSISKRTGISFSNIFVNCRRAHSDMVFDDGELVSW